MLTGKQKRYLQAAAVELSPVVQIGKNGLDAAVITSARLVIAKRELIKVKLNHNSPAELNLVMQELADELRAELIQVIGKSGVFFKAKKKDTQYPLPEAD